MGGGGLCYSITIQLTFFKYIFKKEVSGASQSLHLFVVQINIIIWIIMY